jgi:hypothetical protein
MKMSLAAAVIALTFLPSDALAQERAGDAALGALSGAIILGPVGAVAGAVVGYTTGPAIARSWGLRRSAPRHVRRPAKRPTQAAPKQRASPQNTGAQAASGHGPASMNSPSTANGSPQSTAARGGMPPVQPLE